MQLTIATQVAVFSVIVITFTLLAKLAQYLHDRLIVDEELESMENKPQATTATILQPLATLLPILGWLIAMQRMVTGAARARHDTTSTRR
jgi:hypothetical protein